MYNYIYVYIYIIIYIIIYIYIYIYDALHLLYLDYMAKQDGQVRRDDSRRQRATEGTECHGIDGGATVGRGYVSDDDMWVTTICG